MRKLFTATTLAVVLLSTSSFAIKTQQNIATFPLNAEIRVGHIRHLTDVAGVRPAIGDIRTAHDFVLPAGRQLSFDPTMKENGLYKMTIILDGNTIEAFFVVDDALPSGFMSFVTDQLPDNTSVAFNFFTDPAIALPANLDEQNILKITQNTQQFSHTVNGITVHFIRNDNGTYRFDHLSYADDRPDIVPPRAIGGAAGAQAAAQVDDDNDADEIDPAVRRVMEETAREHAELQAALAASMVAQQPIQEEDMQHAEQTDDLSEAEALQMMALQWELEDQQRGSAAQAAALYNNDDDDNDDDAQEFAAAVALSLKKDDKDAAATTATTTTTTTVAPQTAEELAHAEIVARRQMMADLHAARLARQAAKDAKEKDGDK